MIPVPVRKSRRSSQSSWVAAKSTYFSEEWTGNRVLESLYGRFGKAEFLDAPKPAQNNATVARRKFYRALGVADAPRQFESTETWQLPHSWLSLPDVRAAKICPDGHR